MPIKDLKDSSPPFSFPPDSISSSGAGSSVDPNARNTPVDASPSVEFLPYVDEGEEKRKFWQAVIITVAVFVIVSVLLLGFIVSQRLSSPSTSKIDVKYVDNGPAATNGTLPPRQPTRTPIPTKAFSAQPTLAPLTRIPTSRLQPTSRITYIVQSPTAGTPQTTIPVVSATATPTAGPSTTPSVSVTLLPTMTPSITPTLSGTPTTIPTPTAYLVTSVDTYNYTTVYAGTSATATFQIYNTGGTSLYVSSIKLVPENTSSAFSIVAGGTCVTDVSPLSPPVIINAGSLKCVNVQVAPTYYTVNTSTLQILWNGTYIKNITLSVTVPTPTPSPTP